jgi:hypothetical protein
LTNPKDKIAMELMAVAWEKAAAKRKQLIKKDKKP